VVTEAAVWGALAEIPDPEIPVISLVDLGVVKSVQVEAERVRIEFTPTFMGPRSTRCGRRWRRR
jgi:ring-1,2-phenylacetyl-CoA epoxidase subunit PaaD